MTKKTKVLIVPGYKLFPYETGAGVAQYNFIDAIREHVQLSILISPVNVTNTDIMDLKNRWPNVEFLHWSYIPSSPVKPTISQRVVNKLKSITAPERKEVKLVRSEKYQKIHYNIENILCPSPDWMINGLREILTRQDFDLVQFDLPINIGLASVVAGKAKTLFVHHEVKFQRIASSLTGDEEDIKELRHLQKEVENAEVSQLNLFDSIQVFSAEDRELLEGKLDKPIHVCPFALKEEQFQKPQPNESLERLVFIGSDEHTPNFDALQWFIEEWLTCFPNENVLPIHVIGKWSEENRAKLSRKNLHFEGFVPSIAPWMRKSVLLAPIRVGAGLRTKIMEAMAMSAPVIATRFAAQGLGTSESEILYAESGKECWEKIEQISKDDKKFQLYQEQSFKHAYEHFSMYKNIDKRLKIIDKTLTSPDE